MMHYYSTNQQAGAATLPEAVLKGLADDGGLYMPEHIPKLPPAFFTSLQSMSLQEIAYTVAAAFVQDHMPANTLRALLDDTLDFPIPLQEVESGIYSLELFHGPTMAFKDVGARFMSRLMAYFTRDQTQPLKVVVATSGDTGSAVAAGFYNVSGIQVYILFPKGKVSPLQQKQLTTWGGNITAIEVDGTFDDCQRLAKQALSDKVLNKSGLFTSANSINIARLIPQSFYFFYAYAQLMQQGRPVVFSVPSGNFGNLTGGLLAAQMGLPVAHFIAATNANDVVPHYLRTGQFEPRPSIQTISNAMDVGNPSNYARMRALFSGNHEHFSASVSGYTFTDAETRQALCDVQRHHQYVLDPHGAVAYLGLKRYLTDTKSDAIGVFLETAHPAKFREVMENALQQPISIPAQLEAFLHKREDYLPINNDYNALKALLTASE